MHCKSQWELMGLNILVKEDGVEGQSTHRFKKIKQDDEYQLVQLQQVRDTLQDFTMRLQ